MPSTRNIKNQLQSLATGSDAAGQVAAQAAELAKHVQDLEDQVDSLKAELERLRR